MLIHHLRMTTSGSGGNMSHKCSCGGKTVAKPHRRIVGNGLTPAIYDESLANVRPTRLLQNIRIKKSLVPKKYITFE